MKEKQAGKMVLAVLFLVLFSFGLSWGQNPPTLLVVVRASDDSLWKMICDDVACSPFSAFPGMFRHQPTVTWDEKTQEWVIVGTASDNSIWMATFDRSGNFNNDWHSLPGRTPSPAGASGSFYTLGSLSCSSGQIPKWSGSVWGCGDDLSGGGTPSSTVTNLDGTPLPGISDNYSRGDHKHGIGTGSVTSAHILNGTILNEDISGSAAIDIGKLSGVAAAGHNHDATYVNVGETNSITSGMIVNSSVTKSKLSPSGGTAGQTLGTDGTSLVWQNDGLTLPYFGLAMTNQGALAVTNLGASGTALWGLATDGLGVYGEGNGTPGYGVWGKHTGTGNQGVVGSSLGGVVGIGTGNSRGVHGQSDSATGVHGQSGSGYGVFGESNGSGMAGVYGGNSGGGYGVYGSVSAGTGVFGHSYYHYGMFAESQQGTGMTARHINTGNYADIGTAEAAIKAVAVSGGNTAIISKGDLVIDGGLNSFRGTVGSNNGAPFPRPAYDSGWVSHGPGYYNYNYNTELPTYTYSYENLIVDVKFMILDEYSNPVYIINDSTAKNYFSVFYWWVGTDNVIGTLTNSERYYRIRIRVWHIN